jgi:hypothetical protein
MMMSAPKIGGSSEFESRQDCQTGVTVGAW